MPPAFRVQAVSIDRVEGLTMWTQGVGRWTVPLLAVICLGAAARELPLVEAVKEGSTEAVRALLDQRVDVNAAEADGTTALHWAVQGEAAALVGVLIDAGANVTAANRYGVTPLSLACLTGNAAIIAQLLGAGADANAVRTGGHTALMTAARTGNVAAVEVLVAHGADVHAKDDSLGQTALMWAAAENNVGVVDTLVQAGADVRARTKYGFTAFLFAVRAGRIEAATALLAAGADVNEALPNGITALLLAITNAKYELAANLMREGADPNADAVGWSALHQLAWSRRPALGFSNPEPVHRDNVDGLDLARQLLTGGANPNARIQKELKDAPRPRSGGGTDATPFLLAARLGDVDLMRVLVEHGADPLLPNEDNRTPLMVAAGVGVSPADPGTDEEALEAVKFVLDLGGEVTTADTNGDTALHGATRRGANAIVQLLADQGAKLDVTNEKGWTPLTIAEGLIDGVLIDADSGEYRRQPHTAALLRQLLDSRTRTLSDQPR